jgi:hypothetical protein
MRLQMLANKGLMVEDIFNMCEIIYLENVKTSISKFDSIKTFLEVKYLPANFLVKKYIKKTKLEDIAFIIYSTGRKVCRKE